MSPETWTDVANWLMLALGAAMFFGTGFAMLTYRRTGLFPGQPVDDDGLPAQEPSITGAWVKVSLGLVIGVWGLAGLTTGTIVGT